MNPLKTLHDYGQSLWLDYIRRDLLAGGDLTRLIEEDGLLGITSNPAIFEKAIGGSHDYDDQIRSLALQGRSALEIYEALAIEDVQMAADQFRPVYDRLDGGDGFVSLEVNPHLAHDTDRTIKEARRLWAAVNRPNTFIKVPGTIECLSAIRQLVSDGVNINITLLFSVPRYRKVAAAYIAGIEERIARGQPVQRVASVASFFLSRIDVLVDPILEDIASQSGTMTNASKRLQGQIAIASAKVAYQAYKQIFEGEFFKPLTEKGASSQRLLWASTGTKTSKYSDVKYVEPLIGPHTVNSLPLETINAYRDHGAPGLRLEEGADEASTALNQLADLGIRLDEIAQQLEDEGIEKFSQPLDSLMTTIIERAIAAA